MLVEIKPDLTESIQEQVLNYLGLGIVDLETLTDLSIPDGCTRYQAYRYARPFCTISKWGDRYYTRAVHNPTGYRSLYEAATCWVDRAYLLELQQQIGIVAMLERSLIPELPNYI
jgi:hypothetical protein